MLVVGDDWSGKDNSGGKMDRSEQAAPMGKNSNLKSLYSKENRSKDAQHPPYQVKYTYYSTKLCKEVIHVIQKVPRR